MASEFPAAQVTLVNVLCMFIYTCMYMPKCSIFFIQSSSSDWSVIMQVYCTDPPYSISVGVYTFPRIQAPPPKNWSTSYTCQGPRY